MPSSYTENYSLSQWEKSDKVQMEDFNADNAKIDAALKAEAAARTAETAALSARVARLGNCRLYTATYTGNGAYGSASPNTHTFPGKPLVVFITTGDCGVFFFTPEMRRAYALCNESGTCSISWSGNTASWASSNFASQMNRDGVVYTILALLDASK